MQLILGDCSEKLKELPDNSVDTIITDPPYGLKFMGKGWDYDVPSVEIWKETLRVLKPGGTALIFAGSRTQHRMAINVEDAGFVLKDTIMWLYGSGFPKSLNIGKVMDKYLKTGNASWNGTGDSSNGALGYSKLQHNQGYRPADYSNKHQNKEEITEDLAKKWEGWGTALKPAYEPILVAMKPNDGSYAENALKWGVGGLNIDECRIQFRGKECYEETINKNRYGDFNSNGGIRVPTRGIYHGDNRPTINYEPIGRFPANIILDEEAGKMLDEQSGISKGGKTYDYTNKKQYQVKGFIPNNKPSSPSNRGDKGGASRFFYCAKANRKERNIGCDELEKRDGGSNVKGYTQDVARGLDRNRPVANFHPTVKPLKLMEYLCTLTKTPTGGIVLDHFMGSGTTGMACVNTGRDFIGVEMDEDYFKIAQARIEACKANRQPTFE